MSLFDNLGAAQNPMQLMSQLRANPAALLRRRGLNVPDGMNDPNAIINHLLQTGQISNSRLQMAQMMMRR